MDLYCRLPGEGGFDLDALDTNSELVEILQEINMLFETKPGDVLGVPNMGIDLESILYTFNMSPFEIKDVIQKQINTFIPEAADYDVKVDVRIERAGRRDIGKIDILLKDKLITYTF